MTFFTLVSPNAELCVGFNQLMQPSLYRYATVSFHFNQKVKKREKIKDRKDKKLKKKRKEKRKFWLLVSD